MERVVFLDRDGTINKEVNYLYKKDDLELLPKVPEAISLLRNHGYKIVVVTNQAGVARGYYSEEDVNRLHQYLNQLLKKQNAGIDDFFFCPHHPEYGIGKYRLDCNCRKPGTGMFEQLEQKMKIDKEHSFMIGDKLLDVQAGKRFGIRGILVATGYGESEYQSARTRQQQSEYEFYAPNLMAAAEYIIRQDKKEKNNGNE